jgi:hypothetical protein
MLLVMERGVEFRVEHIMELGVELGVEFEPLGLQKLSTRVIHRLSTGWGNLGGRVLKYGSREIAYIRCGRTFLDFPFFQKL